MQAKILLSCRSAQYADMQEDKSRLMALMLGFCGLCVALLLVYLYQIDQQKELRLNELNKQLFQLESKMEFYQLDSESKSALLNDLQAKKPSKLHPREKELIVEMQTALAEHNVSMNRIRTEQQKTKQQIDDINLLPFYTPLEQ